MVLFRDLPLMFLQEIDEDVPQYRVLDRSPPGAREVLLSVCKCSPCLQSVENPNALREDLQLTGLVQHDERLDHCR